MRPDLMRRLIDIMARLRDPQGGCPWDLKQTYRTIVPYTIEEAYEVADTIERGDLGELKDELGDLLFQVVFYARLAEEEGQFAFDDIVQAICDKMIRRHPHVFADRQFDDEQALRAAWDGSKAAERDARHEQGRASQMDGVPRALPALVRAEKLQRRAARVGFDWPDISGAFDKCREEIAEVEEAMASADPAHLEDEIGDLFFALVNVSRFLKIDAEQAVRNANAKFERRFRALEDDVTGRGLAIEEQNLTELDQVWETVKAREKGGDA